MHKPHIAPCVGATLGALIGLWPSMLPRGAMLTGAVVTGSVVIGTLLGVVVARYVDTELAAVVRGQTRARRWPVPATIAVLGIGGAVSMWWQNELRADLGFPLVDVQWWALAVGPACFTFLALVFAPRAALVAGFMMAALSAGYLAPTEPATAAAEAATPRSPAGVLYAPITDEPLERRADHLVDRWVDSGGLDADSVVVAVPTGSGWVDPEAVAGLRSRFGPDVPVLALQYGETTCWQAFVTDRGAAGRSATAVLSRVAAAAGYVDEDCRDCANEAPKIYLYGQSLGALGADEVRVWAEQQRPGAVSGTLLSGVPAGTVAPSAADSSRVVLANASDPVARWSPSLLWRPATLPDDTEVVGEKSRRMPWLPGVSFLHTTIDLLGSLDGPAGTGHHYGVEQGEIPVGESAVSLRYSHAVHGDPS